MATPNRAEASTDTSRGIKSTNFVSVGYGPSTFLKTFRMAGILLRARTGFHNKQSPLPGIWRAVVCCCELRSLLSPKLGGGSHCKSHPNAMRNWQAVYPCRSRSSTVAPIMPGRLWTDTKALTISGKPGQYRLQPAGTVVSLADTARVEQLVSSGKFETTEHKPRKPLEELQKTSQLRAEAVRSSLFQYARHRGLRLDESQFRAVGMGMRDPVVPVPGNAAGSARNRRIEFRLEASTDGVPGAAINYWCRQPILACSCE